MARSPFPRLFVLSLEMKPDSEQQRARKLQTCEWMPCLIDGGSVECVLVVGFGSCNTLESSRRVAVRTAESARQGKRRLNGSHTGFRFPDD